jgi:hypothetical protein
MSFWFYVVCIVGAIIVFYSGFVCAVTMVKYRRRQRYGHKNPRRKVREYRRSDRITFAG